MKPLSEVTSARGAPMGRRSTIVDPDTDSKFYLQQMQMVDGDYDAGGAYWGGGNYTIGWMYRAVSGENEIFIRAKNRGDAKNQVRVDFPNARFYR